MKTQKMKVKSKVWIEAGGEVVAGDGKIDLLERIAERYPASRGELALVPGIRGWQVEAFGDRMVEACRSES